MKVSFPGANSHRFSITVLLVVRSNPTFYFFSLAIYPPRLYQLDSGTDRLNPDNAALIFESLQLFSVA